MILTFRLLKDKVIQPGGEVIAAEGDSVTLNCTFETIDTNPYLFWYKQEVNSYPKYMLRRDTYETEDNAPEFKIEKFSAKLKDKSVPLMIHNLHVSDSAVYYCALKPTVTRNRIYKMEGLKIQVKNKLIDLQISSAAVADSAVEQNSSRINPEKVLCDQSGTQITTVVNCELSITKSNLSIPFENNSVHSQQFSFFHLPYQYHHHLCIFSPMKHLSSLSVHQPSLLSTG
uniref:Ig-like domain-containing protein n=1 Tax=Oryzias melastigma TaxID=30732 RepID=A0A3B3BWM8_ORYME